MSTVPPRAEVRGGARLTATSPVEEATTANQENHDDDDQKRIGVHTFRC
jgi:hypothetical protein